MSYESNLKELEEARHKSEKIAFIWIGVIFLTAFGALGLLATF